MLIVALIALQVIIFTALIFMFRRILNKNVVSATQHLEELDRANAEKELEINKRLEKIKQDSEKIIAKAQQKAEEEKARITGEAEAEKDKILKQSRARGEEIMQQASKSRQLLLSEIEKRIEKEAVNKACELIHDTLPKQFKEEIHSQWVKNLIEYNFRQLERLHIPKDVKEVKVTSAFPLDKDQKKDISKKVKALLGRDVDVNEKVDPKIVAGIVVAVGSLVLDGSLKNKILEHAESIKKE